MSNLTTADRTIASWMLVPPTTDVWTIQYLLPNGWGWRSTAFRLADQSIAVISPIKQLPEHALSQLETFGKVSFLLAPNHFHYLGLPRFTEHFSRNSPVTTVTSDQALKRLRKKSPITMQPLGVLSERLPAHMALIVPPSLVNGEVWLRVTSDNQTIWVVSDAFFHLPTNPTGFTGTLLRWLKTTPGLQLGNTFRWLAIGKRHEYKQWLLEQLTQDRPQILVPGHGEILTSTSLTDQLRTLATQRL